MAAASGASLAAIRGPVGYPQEIFETIDAKYLCGRCEFILKNPIQSFCGHRFCQDCFNYLIENNKDTELVCPMCKSENAVADYSILSSEQMFPDNALKREFFKLTARCPYAECSFCGSFKDFEIHYPSCEFKPAPPSEDQLLFNDESVPEVFADLHRRLTLCEQSVGQMSNRVNTVEQDIRRLQSEAGSETSSVRDSSVARATSLSGATAVEAHALAATSSASAASETSQLKETEEKMELMEKIVTIFCREMEKYSNQVFAMERQNVLLHDNLSSLGRNSIQVEQLMASKDAAIGDVEKRVATMDETSYTGTLLWKITNFKQCRLDAISGNVTSIYSPPFWTSRTGYKMCARIYLNGDGIGKGTHVSLFFVMMRGQFDALLRWPFRQKVTLMFLDQSNRNHITDSFRPDPTSSSFKRPTAEMNVASGCPLFMPLTNLDGGMHDYVVDDTAFVKVIVSLDGLT